MTASRRRWSFGLRTLFVAVTVCTCSCSAPVVYKMPVVSRVGIANSSTKPVLGARLRDVEIGFEAVGGDVQPSQVLEVNLKNQALPEMFMVSWDQEPGSGISQLIALDQLPSGYRGDVLITINSDRFGASIAPVLNLGAILTGATEDSPASQADRP